MTSGAFTASLERSAAQHPPSKARRIAALLPQIEAAMAQGNSRTHIVTALLDMGIAITPHQLSNVMARLRRQRQDGSGLPVAGPALTSARTLAVTANSGLRVGMDRSSGPSLDIPVTRIASVPTLARGPSAVASSGPAPSPAPVTGRLSKFDSHDPRLLDEVMRTTPDMKALAKLAPRSKP